MIKKISFIVLSLLILQPMTPLLAMEQNHDVVDPQDPPLIVRPATNNWWRKVSKKVMRPSNLLLLVIGAVIAYQLLRPKTKTPPPVRPAGIKDTPCPICLTDSKEIVNPVVPKCGHPICNTKECYRTYIQEKVEMKTAVDTYTNETIKDPRTGKDALFEERYINDKCPMCQEPLFPNNVHHKAPTSR